MKREEFALALNALLPGCDPEAPEKWAEFANDCVYHNEYAWFIPMDDRNAAAEKWLDATFAGLYAVTQEFGPEIAAKVAELSCQRCAIYPSEMPAAAEILKNGGDAERISGMMASDLMEVEPSFPFDLPDGAALTLQGPEISIAQSGVPCGLMDKRIEPGYLLADGTALLESERDDFGRYRGGAGMDGMYLQTGRLYAPVRGMDGQIRAFQEVKTVTAREREAAFLAGQGDAFALYRLKTAGHADPEGYVPLTRLQKSGASPLDGNYDLTHVIPLAPGADFNKTLEACRSLGLVKPCDIAAFKQAGAVTCWYVNMLAYSRLPGLLDNSLNAAEIGAEQNYNQIDGIINNEAAKPSVRDSLKHFQRETDRPHGDDAPGKPHRDPER